MIVATSAASPAGHGFSAWGAAILAPGGRRWNGGLPCIAPSARTAPLPRSTYATVPRNRNFLMRTREVGLKKRCHVERKVKNAVLDQKIAVPKKVRRVQPVEVFSGELVEGMVSGVLPAFDFNRMNVVFPTDCQFLQLPFCTKCHFCKRPFCTKCHFLSNPRHSPLGTVPLVYSFYCINLLYQKGPFRSPEKPDVPRTSLGQDRSFRHDASRKRRQIPILAQRMRFQVHESLSFGQSSRFLILRVAAISYHFAGI